MKDNLKILFFAFILHAIGDTQKHMLSGTDAITRFDAIGYIRGVDGYDSVDEVENLILSAEWI